MVMNCNITGKSCTKAKPHRKVVTARRCPWPLTGLMEHSDTDQVVIKAPAEAGAYRLFVYVRDGHGNAGHANIPFLVE